MKHQIHPRLAAVVLAGFLSATPASAETQPDISGRWLFKTGVLPNKGCVISGEIRFTKVPNTKNYVCSFVSREDCDRPGSKTFTKVQQSCSTSTANGEIVITSTIDRIVDAGPADFKQMMFASQAYAPDHFRVHPEKGELVGIFHSSRQAPVRFWRDVDLVS